MNKRDQYKRLFSFGASMILLGFLTAFFGFIWYRYYSDTIILPYYRRGNWVLIAIYTILIMIFFKAYGGFKVGYLKKTDMFYSQMISIVCVNVITYFQISLIGRDFMRGFPIVYLTGAEIVFIFFWNLFVDKIYFLVYPPRRLIILYGSRQAASLVMKMSTRVDKYMICESVNIGDFENEDEVKKHILKYEGVIICDIPAKSRNDYMKFCFKNDIRAYIVPKISDIILRGAEDIRLFDTPLILCRNGGLTFEQRFIKRMADIIISLLMIILFSPIMLVTALAVKLCDGGNIIYRQKRLTIDEKEFYIYKFRSMIADAEKSGIPQLAKDYDKRITPVGRIIRSCRIDELPQLFNILKGDMSIVGPRPERPELAEEYEKTIPEFKYRLKVKAGLTGYAQVTGTYDTTPYDKLKMDLMYIENYSFRLDLQLMLMTLKTMFFPNKTNAETEKEVLGIDENNTQDRKEGRK
ncbi:MAG: exopolysaccharide biosynthesis polyprenyl glycosylphosphotransferase [Ruminococcus sp.]|nr:exopolysaccharide biosynthesis polyprenyl glycosylphosphotransferase [Oscillospiraceae bacterium]MDY4413295.1 exopolysaccharide biosynthesis polyprenyl glycosylphosphotransferase [Ruminococcus sp.]